MAERDTSGLSGGELQRLAVAAALARKPALLIADEVTSMVDQQGRDALLRVMSGLAERHQTALVHITHYNNEAEFADRQQSISPIQLIMPPLSRPHPRLRLRSWRASTRHAPVLELTGVSHEYGSGTPWATERAARYQLYVGARVMAS